MNMHKKQWIAQTGMLGPKGRLEFVGPFRSEDEIEDYFIDHESKNYSAIPLTPPSQDMLGGVRNGECPSVSFDYPVGHTCWAMVQNRPVECKVATVSIIVTEKALVTSYGFYVSEGGYPIDPSEINPEHTTKQKLLESL